MKRKVIVFGLVGLLILGTFFGCSKAASTKEAESATLVLKNGAIYTMDEEDRVASAVAVINDQIVYVGDDAGVESYVGDDTEVIDLDGKMVTPGFIDGHIHAASDQLSRLYSVYLTDTEPDIKLYQAALKEFAEKHPELEVIIGRGFQLKAFGDEGPTKDVLDEIISDRPVIISDTSGHGDWVNTKTLEMAGITKDTQAPAGGEIYRDANGEPSGYLSDAGELIANLTEKTKTTPEQFFEAFKVFEDESAAKGITGINSMGSDIAAPVIWKMMDDYAKTGEMTLRVKFAHRAVDGDDPAQIVKELQDGQQYVSDMQNIIDIKTFIDGVPEGKTSYLLKPYAATANMAEDYRGEAMWSQESLNEFVAAADKAGYAVDVHAMGDASSRMFIDAVEYAFEQNGKRDARHNLIHANLLDPADIPRMGELGIYAGMQPIWFYKDPIFSQLEIQMLGQERFDQEYVIRDMLEAGIIMTGSSDSPVTTDNRPLIGIECGVTQCSPYPGGGQGDPVFVRNVNQTVSVIDMLRFYTINGAKEMFMEKTIGSIEVGKKADMVVLTQDITKIKPDDISETEVVSTIFNGKIVYQK
ncbi:amidohydrolase [Sinanaerobacter chloroacetimidivorans]|uniref:Amidohydrolase n=1 Tax=Sinanaerobacter chloroacetimidivorans TaxID=2818044 RepID=A0A8J8B4S1_9FIRM|nr:amidohydrolase [Sinanaerobacter chloroacetimidivorans]MBR0599620.1 amidohydrolase [Sinanaerobacter chloroacetimidivorans]